MHYSTLASLCILFTMTTASAVEFSDRNFVTENLGVNNDNAFVISSFEELDYFTVYTHAGDLVWEAPFNAKILSWKSSDGLLFIFSKARDGRAYYLTCLDMESGKLLWEKGIYTKYP